MNNDYMKRAIELANRGAGFVNPNPLSGAVIVRENRIIGEGYYKSYGARLAEAEALMSAPKDLAGAELYLNIEPFGCESDLFHLIYEMKERGINKLYIGMSNPNPKKEFDFLKELKRQGIDYELGILKEECEELNEIYAFYSVNRQPYVIVKWAMTLDGKLASRTGDSKWISSEESLRFVHQLRQRVGAILVGENTVIKDNPLLTTRLEGVEISNPLRVVISKYGNIPMEAKVLQVDENTKTLVFVSEFIPKEKEEALLDKGVQVIKLKEENNHISFLEVVQNLGDMGIDSLYIEGGSAILASAFDSRVVQKVYTAIAPKIIGGIHAITPVGGQGIELMRNALELKKVSYEVVGPDVIVKGYLKE